MPPWNQMTPQQQMLLLQMMHGGMQQQMAAPGQAQLGLNPSTAALTNQLANPQGMLGQMNPQMLQYLMGLQGQGAAPPNLSQFLSGQHPAPAYTQYPGF